MSNLYPVKAAVRETAPKTGTDDFAAALMSGLSATPKRIACKYFYDTRGSALFDQICLLPEYYVTRTELGLLARHAIELGSLAGPDAELIEFGAGSGQKVRLLLDAMIRPRAYLPVDISGDYLAAAAGRLDRDYPDVTVKPVVADFSRPFALPPPAPRTRRRIGFFPGSTIGNFTPVEALHFLGHAAHLLRDGALLVGADLVKDPAVLHAAYNDGEGVTAAFNKNVLARANRELGANFNLSQFHHYACYNPLLQRVEMYLVSAVRQSVRIDGQTVGFAQGEAVHTENSHKYTVEGFRALAANSGFTPRAVWCDPARLFSLHWLDAN